MMKSELSNIKLIRKIAEVKGVKLSAHEARAIYVKLANAQLDAILDARFKQIKGKERA